MLFSVQHKQHTPTWPRQCFCTPPRHVLPPRLFHPVFPKSGSTLVKDCVGMLIVMVNAHDGARPPCFPPCMSCMSVFPVPTSPRHSYTIVKSPRHTHLLLPFQSLDSLLITSPFPNTTPRPLLSFPTKIITSIQTIQSSIIIIMFFTNALIAIVAAGASAMPHFQKRTPGHVRTHLSSPTRVSVLI